MFGFSKSKTNEDAEGALLEEKGYVVRRAKPRDSMLISGLSRNDWSERIATSTRRGVDSASNVAEELTRGGGVILTKNNMPIGGAFYVVVRDTTWELRRLGVLRQYSGRGLTGFLIKAIEKEAVFLGIDTIRLPVAPNEVQTRQYFEILGYRLLSTPSFLTRYEASAKPIMLIKHL